jgi:hypothetical protein
VKLRCPYCFTLLGAAPTAFRCEVNGCTEEPDAVASSFFGAQVVTRPVIVTGGRGGQNGAACRKCRNMASLAVCSTCHAPLPANWYQCQTTCIAMAGARASGKSIYIAVLKRQAEKLCELMGLPLDFMDVPTERIYKRVYQAPLYEQRGLLAPTARHETTAATQRTPLMFSMGMIGNRQHVLVIRDVAGENLEDPTADPHVFSFFSRADGVVFLFDPMRIEEIRRQLAGVIPEQAAVGGDPMSVLGNLVRLMRISDQPIGTPLAVVLAKFDTLHELIDVVGSPWRAAMANAGAAYSRDPSLNRPPAYDEADGRLLDAEVTSLLTKLNARQLLNKVRQEFSNSRMFAVSALGAAPVGQALHPRGIAPFRCLDPLKWILAGQGVLDWTGA